MFLIVVDIIDCVVVVVVAAGGGGSPISYSLLYIVLESQIAFPRTLSAKEKILTTKNESVFQKIMEKQHYQDQVLQAMLL